MTPYEYLLYRNDPSKDTMPVLYHWFELNSKTSLSYSEFIKTFSVWLWNIVGIHRLGDIVNYTFMQLDKKYAKYL
jgi:hypothetical protein